MQKMEGQLRETTYDNEVQRHELTRQRNTLQLEMDRDTRKYTRDREGLESEIKRLREST